MAGNVIYAACQWGILVALAKQGTPTMVGQFALGLAICAPAFMLTNLQLRAVQATDTRGEFAFGHYLTLRLIGTALALAAVFTVTMAAGYRHDTTLIILGVATAKAAESVSDVIYGLWQARERLDNISKAMMGRGILSLSAFAVVLRLTRSLVWAVLALVVVWTAWLLTYERSVATKMLGAESTGFSLSWHRGYLLKLAALSAPLGIVMLLLSLNANIPRYVLQRYHGEAALGYLAAISYMIVASTTLMSALGVSAAPRFARSYLTNRAAFLSLVSKMVSIAFAIGGTGVVVVTVWGRQILSLVYRSDYGEHADVLLLLMIAGCADLLSSALGFAFTATRRFKSYLIPVSLNTAVGGTVALLLIPSLGLRGAALTSIVISVGQLIVVTLLLRGALTAPRNTDEQTAATTVRAVSPLLPEGQLSNRGDRRTLDSPSVRRRI